MNKIGRISIAGILVSGIATELGLSESHVRLLLRTYKIKADRRVSNVPIYPLSVLDKLRKRDSKTGPKPKGKK